MIVFFNEANEVVESMKKVLKIIEYKLEQEEIQENVNEFLRYQIKADWVKAEIKSWEKLLSQ